MPRRVGPALQLKLFTDMYTFEHILFRNTLFKNTLLLFKVAWTSMPRRVGPAWTAPQLKLLKNTFLTNTLLKIYFSEIHSF